MFKSYLLVAWRNLIRSKVYSLINIAGLAAGLACALAIALFIADEYSYDRFHKNANNIYRVVQDQDQSGNMYSVASTPAPLAEALKNDFPEVINACRVRSMRNGILQSSNAVIETPAIRMADEGFLEVFDFEVILGNRQTLFKDPRQIVITERTAATLFGAHWASHQELIGSTIIYDKKKELVLAGVIREAPVNSHLQFDAILTFDPNGDGDRNWLSNNYLTYIELTEGADVGAVNERLRNYASKFVDPAIRTFSQPVFYLQRLTDIYLYSDFDFHTDWTKTSSIVYVKVFLAVGLVVLIIAVFNFINLSTARAMRRAREVGVRKTIGAYHTHLIAQFLSESLLITSISVAIAFGILAFALPQLNNVSSKTLVIPFSDPMFVLLAVAFTVLVSILAGTYPAIYLSGFQAAKVLKGMFSMRSGKSFRHVLVIVQFTLTVVLVAASIIIYKQLAFINNKDLGFEKNNLIYLQTERLSRHSSINLRDELKVHSSISSASLASNSLIDVINSTSDFSWQDRDPEDKFLITHINSDASYLSATGMRLIEGRNFEEGRKDTASYIINETAAKRMGWDAKDAIGKLITFYGKEGNVIGVLKDFHFRPMTMEIEPFILMSRNDRPYAGILIRTMETREAIADIEKVFKNYESETPAHFSFVDERLDQQYHLQQTTGKLVLFFSILDILVACLGLYGLAAFTTERRTKEIGIRKVLGASVASVSMLLSRDFVSLVMMSVVMATPVAYLLMRNWLESFVYRIDLSWSFFVLAGLLALSIAVLTVLRQAIAAASRNPVVSLRTE